MSYPGHSAEMQSVYYTAQGDWIVVGLMAYQLLSVFQYTTGLFLSLTSLNSEFSFS